MKKIQKTNKELELPAEKLKSMVVHTVGEKNRINIKDLYLYVFNLTEEEVLKDYELLRKTYYRFNSMLRSFEISNKIVFYRFLSSEDNQRYLYIVSNKKELEQYILSKRYKLNAYKNAIIRDIKRAENSIEKRTVKQLRYENGKNKIRK